MKITFPFEEGKSSIVGKIARPVAHIDFFSIRSNVPQPVTLILDSGADYTLLPRFLASPLEVDLLRDTRKIHTRGVGGDARVYFLKKKINIKVGSVISEIHIGFFNSNSVPPLLGRLDFFDQFRILFENRRTTVSS